MVLTSSSDTGRGHVATHVSRTLPLNMSSVYQSSEMLDIDLGTNTVTRSSTMPYNTSTMSTMPYNISRDVPLVSRNVPTNFSVSYSSDKEDISFSNRHNFIYLIVFMNDHRLHE